MRYKFKTEKGKHGYDICVEHCKVKDCMVGSIMCQDCEHCKEVDKIDFTWIVCEVINEALGKKTE